MGELALPYVPIDPHIREHRKMRRLRVSLGVTEEKAFVTVVSFLLWVGREFPDGHIRDASPEEIAEGCGWRAEPVRLVRALEDAGWLDRPEGVGGTPAGVGGDPWEGWVGPPEGGWGVHGWCDHGGRVHARRSGWASKKANERAARRLVSPLDGDGDGDGDGDVKGKVKTHAPVGAPLDKPKAPPKEKRKPTDAISEWIDRASARATELVGKTFAPGDWGTAHKVIAPVFGQLGADELLERWERFLADAEPFVVRNRSFPFFASKVNAYATAGPPKDVRKGVTRAEDFAEAHRATPVGVISNPWGSM